MTHRRCHLVVAVSLLVVLTPALVWAAGNRTGRLAAGSPPPTPYARWLEGRAPVAPFEAEVVYRTPIAPAAQDGADPMPQAAVRRYLIIVKQSLYPSIQAALATYISDVEAEGLSIEVIQIAGGTAEDLRNLFISKYNEPNGLEGCYLIGNLPPPWFVHPNDYGEGSSATFPCELYLMDMDGAWTDTDSDGKPDLHTSGSGDEGPEIYCGRTLAHNLTLESGMNEVSLITRYLNRVHDYRQGLITSNVTACLYTDDDWAYWHGDYYTRCGYAWQTREEYYDGAQTVATDYKQKLQVPYEYLRIGCHSWSGGHSFKIGSEWTGGSVTSNDIVKWPPDVLFFNLYACSNACWTDSNCMGVWYTMNKGSGLGAVGSSKTGGMNDGTWFYRPIGDYYPIGYSVERWFHSFQPYDNGERSWTFGMLWLGDPTLWRTRVAPSAFELTAPLDGSQQAGPGVLLDWQPSVPAGVYETVTYTLTIDNNSNFCSPELVIDGITDSQYQLTSFAGLVGLTQHWRVEAVTNFGKSRVSSQTWTFTAGIDADYDGMADAWESANGLNPSDPSDALHDADGDLLLNREEYGLDSDPMDAHSPAFVYADDDQAGEPLQDGTEAHPYATIQAAIDAATAPAVVKVLAGTYTEAVALADGVWLVGSGPAVTIIDSQNAGEAVLVDGVSDGLVVGFTLTSSGTTYTALRSVDSTLTVRHCVAAGSRSGFGAGQTGAVTLLNCLAAANAYRGVWQDGHPDVTVQASTIVGNAESGLARWGDGAITITNSILWDNGDDLAIGGSAPVSISYCDISDGDLGGAFGNIWYDPLFVTGPAHAYYLSQTAAGQGADSPCLDAGGDVAWSLGLDRLTTRTDGVRDTGTTDMGYHADYALWIGSITHGSDVTIHWNAQPGLEYIVEWSDDRAAWNEVDVGAVSSWTDTDTDGYARKFYRVREK
jgi:hypothetical protein